MLRARIEIVPGCVIEGKQDTAPAASAVQGERPSPALQIKAYFHPSHGILYELEHRPPDSHLPTLRCIVTNSSPE